MNNIYILLERSKHLLTEFIYPLLADWKPHLNRNADVTDFKQNKLNYYYWTKLLPDIMLLQIKLRPVAHPLQAWEESEGT